MGRSPRIIYPTRSEQKKTEESCGTRLDREKAAMNNVWEYCYNNLSKEIKTATFIDLSWKAAR